MLPLLQTIWVYRAEILMAVQLLNALRKTAREVAREYVRRKVETKLKQSLAAVSSQFVVLVALYRFNVDYPGLFAQCLASLALWAITIFNLGQLTLVTIPELRALHRMLRGKTGYALKYFLEVSLVTELLRLNVVFLAFCLVIGISGRTVLSGAFSYVAPWQELLDSGGKHRPHRRKPNDSGAFLGESETAQRLDTRRFVDSNS